MTENFEAKVDDLYQRPLAEFTSARNALAKTLSGDRKRIIASLPKPTVPLWAINQLYWKDRSTYKALIDAAERLRAAHRAVIGGKKVDLRKPDEVHRAALERAAAKTVGLLEREAGNVSEAARTAIRRTLATLPGAEQAGRLTREPEPAGFSMFAGVTPRAAKIPSVQLPERNQKQQNDAKETQRNEAKERLDAQREKQRAELDRQKAERERAKAVAEARKEMKDAQQAAERATFAVKKAEAEMRKAQESEAKMISRVNEAERRLAELQRN